jgi:[ribosomal protein S18]-alanine N-acetyltransferase
MIRDAATGDIESIQQLLSRISEAARWSGDDLICGSGESLFTRVADCDGTIRGVIVFRMVADEAEILNLAVDLCERRRGIGSRLIDEAVAECKATGVKKIFLEVRESNEAARGFYARMGFSEIGRRREYYREPLEAALVLFRTVE